MDNLGWYCSQCNPLLYYETAHLSFEHVETEVVSRLGSMLGSAEIPHMKQDPG